MYAKKCRTIIFGATFLGISALMNDREGCVLIERTSLLGSEFVDSFHLPSVKITDMQTALGRLYKQVLEEHHYLSADGSVYPYPALSLLCSLLDEGNFTAMLMTETTQIQRQENGFSVTCFNTDGFSTLWAERIIDTTPLGVLHNSRKNIPIQKSLNVLLDRPFGTAKENSFLDAYIYPFMVDTEIGYPEARRDFHSFWEANGGEAKILFEANSFAYTMPPVRMEIEPGFLWIPSCGYDILTAVDEGGKHI